MNKPKKVKRFDDRATSNNDVLLHTPHFSGIGSIPHAMTFCEVVTNFGYMESQLWYLLDALLENDSHTNLISHIILGSLRSVNGKLDLIQTVLENAQGSKSAPPEIDDFLLRCRKANSERNQLVHGRWFTTRDRETVYVARLKEVEGLFDLVKAEKIEAAELSALGKRIWALGEEAERIGIEEHKRRRKAKSNASIASN